MVSFTCCSVKSPDLRAAKMDGEEVDVYTDWTCVSFGIMLTIVAASMATSYGSYREQSAAVTERECEDILLAT
jgi:hypothetical protein